MKKIKYTSIKISNFLSVGNDAIEIEFQKGLNQIDGINSDIPDRKNGVGKTVIANAHFFALFGETINKIKSEFVRNNVTNKDGVVELNFDVETAQGTNTYTIKRYVKKASKVELFLGDADITKSSIKETDKYICDLLSTNANIHRCCDIMTVRDTIPFMEMEAKDKRAFIESIFDIDVFGIMLKDLKKMISDAKKDKDVSAAKVSEIEKSLKSLIEQKEDYDKNVLEREVILENKRNEILEKIVQTEEKISEIIVVDILSIQSQKEKYEEAWNSLDGKIGILNNEISSKETLRKLKIADINKTSSVEEGIICDRCLQEIPHTHIDHLETLKFQYQEVLDGMVAEIDELNHKKSDFGMKKSKIQNKLGEFQDKINEAKVNQQRLEGLENSLKQYKESLDNLKLEELPKANFEENIRNIEERNEEESEILAELQQKLADYDICKFILGEEGVKSFVVKKLLDLLNNTIEKYLIELGLNVRVKFDEYFEEVITADGKAFSYKNASGAEKKSLDFACSFSFSDMRRKINQVSSNVEWLDEVLDSAVDAVGLDLVIKVIKDRIDKNDTCVYLISHRKEVKDKIDGELIMLEKSGKITRRLVD
jgi:DNA repair exonuclease SbcCD ATPase subunit